MIGIGIATYNEMIQLNKNEEESDIYEVVVDLVRTIDTFTSDNFLLIIRDNDSLDFRLKKFTVTLRKHFGHLNTLFLSDTRRSLTDGWNSIISLALEQGCESVISCNQDIIATKYWSNLVKAVKVQSRDMVVPMMNKACYQTLQKIDDDAFKPMDILCHLPVVQGCCFGGSKLAFESNMYDEKNYFDPGFEFGYNEVEWQQRNNDKGGRSLILLNSFVIHMEDYSWGGLESTKTIPWDFKYDRFEVKGQIDFDSYLRGRDVV